VLAADVGGSTVHAAVVAGGRVAHDPFEARSPAQEDPAGVVNAFAEVFSATLAGAPMPERVSVAICGPCEMGSGTFRRPSGKFSRCTGVALVPLLSERLGAHVEFHHDVIAHGVGAARPGDGEVLAVIAGTGASVVVASPGHCDPTLADHPGVGPDGLSVTRFGAGRLAEWAGTDPDGVPWWAPRAALEQAWAAAGGPPMRLREVTAAARRGEPLATAAVGELLEAWVRVVAAALDDHPVDTVVFGGGVAQGLDLADVVAQRLGVTTRYAGPDAALVGAAALATAA
jgi:glucokinase